MPSLTRISAEDHAFCLSFHLLPPLFPLLVMLRHCPYQGKNKIKREGLEVAIIVVLADREAGQSQFQRKQKAWFYIIFLFRDSRTEWTSFIFLFHMTEWSSFGYLLQYFPLHYIDIFLYHMPFISNRKCWIFITYLRIAYRLLF
jgi:hypothetical protein